MPTDNNIQNYMSLISTLISKIKVKNSDIYNQALLNTVNEFFDPQFYLGIYPDVANAGINPYSHYLKHGFDEGRIPGIKIKEILASLDKYHNMAHGNIVAPAPASDPGARPTIIKSGCYEALYDMPLFVNWAMTVMCNYSCSYCFGQARLDKSKFRPLSDFKKTVQSLARLNRPEYDIFLTGGEVTTYSHLVPLMYYIYAVLGKRLHLLNIYTNGSRNVDYFEQFAEFSSVAPFSLTISIHTEFVNPDHIYQILQKYSKYFRININLMFNPEKDALVQEIFNNLYELRRDLKFAVGVSYLRERPYFLEIDSRYTQEQMDWAKSANEKFKVFESSDSDSVLCKHLLYKLFWEIDDNGKKLITYPSYDMENWFRNEQYSKGYFDFRDMYCIAGAHLISINPDGTTFDAKCFSFKKICNIYSDPCINDDFLRVVKCADAVCGCAANDPLLKFRDKEEAENCLAMLRYKQKRLSNG